MLVESRASGERIEIHAPAAIATILGTVVYVAVDPVTGALTFASSQSQVEIRNREGTSQGSTTISAFEKLTVAPGEVHEKQTLSQQQLDALGGCLLVRRPDSRKSSWIATILCVFAASRAPVILPLE